MGSSCAVSLHSLMWDAAGIGRHRRRIGGRRRNRVCRRPGGGRNGRKKRRRSSCQDTLAVPSSDNGSEDTSLDDVELVHLACSFILRFLHRIIFDRGLVGGLGPNSRGRRESTVQEGLDPASRNCALRVGHPTRPRSCCLPLVHRVGTQPLLNLPRGAPGQVRRRLGQHQRFRTRTLGVGPRRGWGLLSERARTSAFATVHRTVPPRGSSARAVSATVVPPDVSPHLVRLAHSPSIVQNSRSRSIRAFISRVCSVEPVLARTILAQEPAAAVLKCRGRTNSTGNGSAPPRSQQPQPPDAALKENRSRSVQRPTRRAVQP